MELKQYLKVAKKYWLFIIIVSLIGILLALFVARKMPQGFVLTQTFFITPPAVQNFAQYHFEAYHAGEKARNFTDTAVAILDSADFKSQVVSPGQAVKIRKLAPQVIQIKAFTPKSEEAKQLMVATASTFNAQFVFTQPLPADPASFGLKEVAPAQAPTQQVVNRQVLAAAGLVLGFAFAVFVVSLKTYFKI